MVNSGPIDSDGQGDRNAKASCTQPHIASDSTQSSSPVTASAASSCKTGRSQTADSDALLAIGPTPTKTEFNSDMPLKNTTDATDISHVDKCMSSSDEDKSSLCCSVPLDKVQGVLPPGRALKSGSDEDVATALAKPTRKLLCLYCDRTFVSANLRQKHVERIHSAKKNRRVSSRKQNQLSVTQCGYCDKLNATENTLQDLFQHFVKEHSSKYFGCLPCEDRFLTNSLLSDHNASFHQTNVVQRSGKTPTKATVNPPPDETLEDRPVVKLTRSKVKPKLDEPTNADVEGVEVKNKSAKLKELRCKKLSVKSSRIALKRRESKRIQALTKLSGPQKKRRQKSEKKPAGSSKPEQINSTKSTEKTKSNISCVNPYPEFDNFYRVKKITDHSIDNLKISSLTFDDVFDKAFFNRIKCNIEENLLHHIDGKLFKNEESENRISNFEKVSTTQQEVHNSSSDNYGCELSLNAVTPVPSLSLNSQFGEDFESQIEYGSKPKKKTQTKSDEVHYKYFTRRKFQAILQQKENRDLSKLDMWTQLVIKNRQQKIIDDKKTAKEMSEYNTCDEYKSKLKREELNRILDRRGPFEDLREEASKKAALDKLNSASEENISHESFTDVRDILDKILNRVFTMTEQGDNELTAVEEKAASSKKQDLRELPSYLNLRRSSCLPSEGDIDKSDKITLICSSQETENFELPTNQVRGKDELIELSGEWARCRMFICAACGSKLPNMKYLLEHKSLYHQNVWVQHYEFVGNQSELYRHLSIPALGKVGAVEDSVQCKLWKRSDARVCTKCGKHCNSLGELHRHILECGGDWTWMLARKKCKYRPYGARSRRKRRGLVQRIRHKQKTDPTEKKKYKKTFEGPRQRPSDADTIQRMLANLPAKRSTRKLISLYDGIKRARNNSKIQQNIKQKKVKCGKEIYKSSNIKETTEKTINTSRVTIAQKSSNSSRRSLRSLNRVLSSRILDTNAKLTVKRKLKVLNEQRRTRQSLPVQETNENLSLDESERPPESSQVKKCKNEKTENALPIKRTSPRSATKNIKKMSMKKLLAGNINIKSFFPVKKRESKKTLIENQVSDDTNASVDTKTRSKRKSNDSSQNVPKIDVDVKTTSKKTKSNPFGKLVRSLSMRKKIPKIPLPENHTIADNEGKTTEISSLEQPVASKKLTKAELDKTNKKRKLKRSFRNVINRVKRLKIDSAPDIVRGEEIPQIKETNENDIKSTFLEERQPEKPNLPPQPVKIVIPSNLEAKENIADISETAHIVMNFSETIDDSMVPENIFKLESNNEKNLQAKGELNFDTQLNDNKIIADDLTTEIMQKNIETQPESKMQPITIETSVKPKIVPLVSPNMKGKIRKPVRGLNDCIAMLTSKLQQKTIETISKVGIFNSLPSKIPPKVMEDPHLPKTECILRIPTFKSHKGIVEETALDLTTKPKNISEDSQPLEKVDNAPQNLSLLSVPKRPTKVFEKWNSVDRIIEDVVENKLSEQPSLRAWNSVDEIIQTVISDYQKEASQEKSRTTVDDIIDFVVAAIRSEGNEDLASRADEKLSHIPVSKSRNKTLWKIKPVSHILSGVVDKKGKNNSSTIQEQMQSPIDEPRNDVDSKGGSASLADKNEENPSTNVLTAKSRNKTTRKIGSLRKPKKKEKNANDTHLQAAIPKECDSPTEVEVLTLEHIVCDIAGAQQSSKCDDSKIQVLNCFKDVSSTATNISNPQEFAKDNSPNVESSADLDSAPAESTDSLLDKAFIKSPEVGFKPLDVDRADTTPRKVGQARKNKSKQKKTAAGESKQPEMPVIETDLDNLLNIKEIMNKTELSVSSFKTDPTAITSDSQPKDLILSNEDEPRIMENKIVIPHNPSDSEDDIPLISLLKPIESSTTENEVSTTNDEKGEVKIDKIDQGIAVCELIEKQITKNDTKSINHSASEQNLDFDGDSGIEVETSNENQKIDTAFINIQESGDDKSNQTHLLNDEVMNESSVSFEPADSPCSDIPKKNEDSLSKFGEETDTSLEADSNRQSQSDSSNVGFKTPMSGIKRVNKKTKKRNRKANYSNLEVNNIEEPPQISFQSSKSIDDVSDFLSCNSNGLIVETNLKILTETSDLALSDTSNENLAENIVEINNHKISNESHSVKSLGSQKIVISNLMTPIEDSTVHNENSKDIMKTTSKRNIKTKKKAKSKKRKNESLTLPYDTVENEKKLLGHSMSVNNNPPDEQYHRKGTEVPKMSIEINNEINEPVLDVLDIMEEDTDTLPLSVLASKDIPFNSGMLKGPIETTEENTKTTHITEKEEVLCKSVSSDIKIDTVALDISPENVIELPKISKVSSRRQNKKNIGKRSKQKVVIKPKLSVSKIMETTNETILSPNNKPSQILPNTILVDEPVDIKSSEIELQTIDDKQMSELHCTRIMDSFVELDKTETQLLLRFQNENLQEVASVHRSQRAKRSKSVRTNSKQMSSNDDKTDIVGIVQRRCRSVDPKSDNYILENLHDSGFENSLFSATHLSDQHNFTGIDSEENNVNVDSLENIKEVDPIQTNAEKNDTLNNKQGEIFLAPPNVNISNLKVKCKIKRRSRSLKKLAMDNKLSENEAIPYQDILISAMVEPTVDLVRCETEMVINNSNKVVTLNKTNDFTYDDEKVLKERSTFLENNVDTNSALPESGIDNINPETPTKRSLRNVPIVEISPKEQDAELKNIDNNHFLPKTPVKRKSKPIKTDCRTPPSDESPLSDYRGSELSESDVEFKIKTPPKRSPRSLRTRNTMSATRNVTKEFEEMSTQESDNSESQGLIKKSLKTNFRITSSEDSSLSGIGEFRDSEMKDTKLMECNIDFEHVMKPRRSRSLKGCFKESTTEVSKETNIFLNTGTEESIQTDSDLGSNSFLTETRLPYSMNHDGNPNESTVETEVSSNSDSAYLKTEAPHRRTRSLRKDFKAYFSDELISDTLMESNETKKGNSEQSSSYVDLIAQITTDVVEDKEIKSKGLFSDENTEKEVSQNGKKIVSSAIINTKSKRLTRTRLKSLNKTKELLTKDIDNVDCNDRDLENDRPMSTGENITIAVAEKLLTCDIFAPNESEVEDISRDQIVRMSTDLAVKETRRPNIKRSMSLEGEKTISPDIADQPEEKTAGKNNDIGKNAEVLKKTDNTDNLNHKIVHLGRRKVNKNRSKSLKGGESMFIRKLEETAEQIMISKTPENLKMNRPFRRSRSLKNVASSHVESLSDKTCEQEYTLKTESSDKSKLNLGTIGLESDVAAQIDYRSVNKTRSMTLKTKDSCEITSIDQSSLDEVEKDEMDGNIFSQQARRPTRRSSSLKNVVKDPEDEPSLEIIDMKDENEQTNLDVLPKPTNPFKRTRYFKTSTEQLEIDDKPLCEINFELTKTNKKTKSSIPGDEVILDSNESNATSSPSQNELISIGTNENNLRSLRKKSAVNYAEVEENSDMTTSPSLADNSHENKVIQDDRESVITVKKGKHRKTILMGKSENDFELVAETSLVKCFSNISNSSVECPNENEEAIEGYVVNNAITKEVISNDHILKEDNISTDLDDNVSPKVKPTKTKKSAMNKKSFKKAKSKSTAIAEIQLDLSVHENLIKEIEKPSENTVEVANEKIESIEPLNDIVGPADTKNHIIEPLNDNVAQKQLDVKEPPIKIIINKQKTRRKSKSIKKSGLKGHNDLFEDFALVIKKKRPAPIIAFTPNTFLKESTCPVFVSKPAEAHFGSAKEEVQADLDASVEEMDMEIDEIPIITNIIENSLDLLPLAHDELNEIQFLDAESEKIELPKVITRGKSKNHKNKIPNRVTKDEVEHSKLKKSTLQHDLGIEIDPISVISDGILEEKSEVSAPSNRPKRKSKIKMKLNNSVKDTGRESDPTSEILLENNLLLNESQSIETIVSKSLESVSNSSQSDHILMEKKETVAPEYTSLDPEIERTVELLHPPSQESSIKDKDIDRIYAFSETEDFEIEKPLELHRRLPRHKETKVTEKVETDIGNEINIVNEENNEEEINETKSLKEFFKLLDEKQDTSRAEIKENTVEPDDNGKRTSMRSAKVKALEHIHDDALAELTESERNRDLKKTDESLGSDRLASAENVLKKNSYKKPKKSQKSVQSFEGINFPHGTLTDKESPLLADLVAELHGLEELENSIERELNADIDENIIEKNCKSNELAEAIQDVNIDPDENPELRRSRRGSRKIASYNENDLVDPLLDEIGGKKKPRKKEDKNAACESKVQKKTKEPETRLNSEQLFDLLKASTVHDTPHIIKQQNLFLDNLEDSSRDLNVDNFDCMFDGDSEKSASLEQEKLVDKNNANIDKVYEFSESPKSTEQVGDKLNSVKQPADTISSTSNSSYLLPTPNLQDSSMDSNTKSLKSDKAESNFCEICNKSFIRIENLIKHRRTLTHIQKLSELEAKQAEKSKVDQISDLTEISEKAEELPDKSDISEAEIVKDCPPIVHSSFSNNHALKLADIINDVLNKPVTQNSEDLNTFSDIVLQNTSEHQPEVKRYKSLGERKSFDSDNFPNDRAESFVSKTNIQISLLEGIIENQVPNNYIDDISISSDSVGQLSGRLTPSETSSKLDDTSNLVHKIDISKPATDNSSFLKPVQYEEISEDSANLRNYEDQKLRKTLNRDEELFLECCSLLKSGSEVSSSYSKNKVISTVGLRQVDEPDWMEKKSLVQKPQFEIIDDSDNNSRIPTPLGDSYDDDASNSNTISSNWGMNEGVMDIYQNRQNVCGGKFSFENISKEKLHDQSLRFEGLLTRDRPSTVSEGVDTNNKSKANTSSDWSANDAKKIITKGARKVFEGLKVSIPTEELNLEEVLNCSPKPKKTNSSNESHSEPDKLSNSPTSPMKAPRKSKPVKKSQIGSNLLFKVNKKKLLSPSMKNQEQDIHDSKNYDVYDFEETQDNTDVFTKPDFRTFRTLKTNEPFNDLESETESRDYFDSFGIEPESVNSSLSSLASTKKTKADENITKKKCMIMGRIFKNAAAKSKIEDIDEEIRDIPTIDNGDLVENYVADCKKAIGNEVKPKLSEKEINLLFDQLLEKKANDKESANSTTTKTTTKSKPDSKKQEFKKKIKTKGKKRARTNSDSTDEEFNLNKTLKKRTNRKNAKEEDNCINLEQELKECIGVASRKSQRKCTSGKQNVLVEYWSSDDSQFEALLESQRIAAEPVEKVVEKSVAEEVIICHQPKELEVVPQVFAKPKVIDKKPNRKKSMERKKIRPRVASDSAASNRRKRAAANPLYHWSSSSEDEASDLIEVKPLRDEIEDDEDRPVQHGWIVGESPKKLVMMLAQAKGKKTDIDCVKEQGKKRTNTIS